MVKTDCEVFEEKIIAYTITLFSRISVNYTVFIECYEHIFWYNLIHEFIYKCISNLTKLNQRLKIWFLCVLMYLCDLVVTLVQFGLNLNLKYPPGLRLRLGFTLNYKRLVLRTYKHCIKLFYINFLLCVLIQTKWFFINVIDSFVDCRSTYKMHYSVYHHRKILHETTVGPYT